MPARASKVAEATVLTAPTDADEGEGECYEFELRSLIKRDEVFSVMEVLVHGPVA
jgi:hypothetical protein